MKSFARITTLFVVLFFLALPSGFLFAQTHQISGKITDEKSRQPLAFVNVVINEGQRGCISDIDGKYEISSDEEITKISFSSLGFETAIITLAPDQKRCNIALKPTTFELSEVTVEAGENPAHRIIDSLVAHRKANNPNSLASYQYNIYDKMVITIDSSDFGKAMAETDLEQTNLLYLDSLLKRSDLMVMETASEVFFKAPDRKLQNVLGTKVAGMKEPTFIYLVNSMQSVSFYDDLIDVTGTQYVNPISSGSKSHYFFNLEAVSPIGQGDTLYVISFHPMLGSTFNGLRGTMTVNSDGWALQSVKAEPDEQGGLFIAQIQQLYQKVEGHWFPKQLNTNLKFPSMVVSIDDNTFPMVAIGKSYLTDIQINPDIEKRKFSDIEILVDPDAAYRDDSFWNDHRIDSLTQRVQATYILVDSLTQGTDIFDQVLGITDKLMSEAALPIGFLNFDLGKIVKLSAYRGLYFGVGGTTNDRLSRHIRLKGFAGYWTRMRYFDYGYGITWLMNRQRQMELGLQVTNESRPMGEFGGFSSGNMLSESEYKYTFYENIHVRENKVELLYSTRFAKYFKAFMSLSSVRKSYNEQFFHIPDESLTEASFTNAEIKLRFAYKEKFLSKPDGIQSLGTTYPIVWLSYQHSFPIWGGQYDFNRIKFEVSKNFYTRYWGVSKVMVQAGYASESCPVMETFNILGTYEPIGLYSPGSFGTMRLDEFFCDRFVALYLSHNFNGMLWNTNSPWFRPQRTLITNMGWGDMRRAQAYPNKNFKTMEKGFFESGFIVKGLLSLPLVNIGAGVFYRYGPYAFDTVWNNFALKMSASLEL